MVLLFGWGWGIANVMRGSQVSAQNTALSDSVLAGPFVVSLASLTTITGLVGVPLDLLSALSISFGCISVL